MLDHVLLWVDVAATAADTFLLARILQLRLQRTYLFIALACLLSVFFDGVQLWLGLNSEASDRVFLYSRFLYAFVYPMVAWDVFEEMKRQISQTRRVALGRLVSGLFFAALFGFILSLFMGGDEGQPRVSFTLALILWAGSCAATLGFFWTVRKALKAQQLTRPHNTFVWMTFYVLTLIGEIVACFGGVAASFANPTVTGIFNLVLLTYGFGITVWCAAMLKRIPSDVSTEASAGVS